MSLHPQPVPPVPEETARVARAAFPKGNIYLQIRDTLGSIYIDEDFADLFAVRGQPAQSPWRLALICIMQYLENLSDRQVAEAVRGRIDWKYALSLPLDDPGFNFSLLSEFRQRLIEGGQEEFFLERILQQLKEKGLLKGAKKQRTDSTHILAAIRPLNRLETLGETMRAALNSLTVAAPDWLAKHLKKDWFDRYGTRVENYRLPKLDSERETLGNQIGADGFRLLQKIYAKKTPEWLRYLPAVEILRQVWVQQFYAPVEGKVQWRPPKDMPPSTIAIHSPLVSSQKDYGVELIGPVRSDPSWQARKHPKFAATNFEIDWDKKVAVCPRGHQSQTWSQNQDKTGQTVIHISFPQSVCRACNSRKRCTRAQKEPRGLTIRNQTEHLALKKRREIQTSPEFLQIYNQRAGIEGTLSQAIRRSDLRQARYLGLAKTHLQNILIAAALNLCRLDAWLNELPLASTRCSRFLTLKKKLA